MTRLWAVVTRGKDGAPRGFEKISRGKVYCIQEDAERKLSRMPRALRESFMVASFLADWEKSEDVSEHGLFREPKS